VYFIRHTNNYPYDPIPDDAKYGRCKKFGEINLVTGEIVYYSANNCRTDVSKCGKLGTKYTEKL
jgi:hypothetical protein